MAMTNTPDKSDLLPCPFCGHDAERITIGEDEPNNAGGDVITCTRCQASSHVEFGRKENLVACWNTRAPYATCNRIDNMSDDAPDMVERVARALHDHEWSGQPKPEPFTDGCRSYWMSAATAAIAALQAVPVTSGEPTEAMVKAGYDAAKKDGLTGPRKDCEQLVRLILTAALQSAPAASEVGERDA